MATLELIWDEVHTYTLWAWDRPRGSHTTARVIKRFKKRVYLVEIGFRGQDQTQLAIIKTARGDYESQIALREYDFYSNELLQLQGQVVPECYGLFKGKVNGIDLFILVLEYCHGPEPQRTLDLKLDENRELMLSVCKLHQVGVTHGNLVDGHHFLKTENGVRIIDFSAAFRHRCRNVFPVLMTPNGPTENCGCPELMNMEKRYGLLGDMASRKSAEQLAFAYW
ncbi:hypothetical protein BDQ12DRAFT_663236 [Crucibulum laeve]|uniref:Protein kinase domain-containing protein n=1 Tax=Crucibulum laeve TaxID=68775 RepID=A0A5C3M9M5_9AGAR|nr:hypothetical protein BDQ12DRAFT_663236 [Crucibulum laeve]